MFGSLAEMQSTKNACRASDAKVVVFQCEKCKLSQSSLRLCTSNCEEINNAGVAACQQQLQDLAYIEAQTPRNES